MPGRTPWSQRQASRADRQLSDSEGHTEDLLRKAADLLSEGTGQLGFFVAASPDRLVVQQVHFVRLSTERVMARGGSTTRLVSSSGTFVSSQRNSVSRKP